MSVELDELQRKWAEYDRVLETNVRLSREIINTAKMDRARPALRSLTVALVIETVLTFAVVVALGSFIYANLGATRFVLPGVALDVYSIVYLHGLIRQLVAVGQIDFTQPVTEVQKKLAALRLLRLRFTKVTFVAVALAWTPLLIVAFKALFGLDAYRLFGDAYLAANVLFGLAVIPLAIWISKKFGKRLEGIAFVRGLVDSLEGYRLAQTAAFLATLAEFQAVPSSDASQA